MKKLSIEEKTKAYDEDIKRLEDIKTGKCQKTFVFTECLFDYIFPELKESEDEKWIPKEIIKYLKEKGFPMGYYCRHPVIGNTPIFISYDGHSICEIHQRETDIPIEEMTII